MSAWTGFTRAPQNAIEAVGQWNKSARQPGWKNQRAGRMTSVGAVQCVIDHDLVGAKAAQADRHTVGEARRGILPCTHREAHAYVPQRHRAFRAASRRPQAPIGVIREVCVSDTEEVVVGDQLRAVRPASPVCQL